MSKKIKIIIKDPKTNQNKISNVTKGYVINYLIPNNLAEIATKKRIKHIEMINIIQNQKLEQNQLKIKNIKNKLILIDKININKKIGDNYNIFGNINEKDIIEKIFRYTNIKLEKKQISIPIIKQIGIFYIKIQLLKEDIHKLKVHVIPVNL